MYAVCMRERERERERERHCTHQNAKLNKKQCLLVPEKPKNPHNV